MKRKKPNHATTKYQLKKKKDSKERELLIHVIMPIYFSFCCLCFRCLIQKFITKQFHGAFPMLSFGSLFSGTTLKSLIHFKLIFWMVQNKDTISFFVYVYEAFPTPFIEDVLSLWYSCQRLDSLPWSILVFISVPYSFDYCGVCDIIWNQKMWCL